MEKSESKKLSTRVEQLEEEIARLNFDKEVFDRSVEV